METANVFKLKLFFHKNEKACHKAPLEIDSLIAGHRNTSISSNSPSFLRRGLGVVAKKPNRSAILTAHRPGLPEISRQVRVTSWLF